MADTEETTTAPASSTATETIPVTWRDSLPAELKLEKGLEKFQDIGALAKSYIEMEKYQGQSIRLPTDTSKPEEWNAVYEKLGRPKTPSDYKLTKPEKLPDELEWNSDAEKGFRELAHKHGLNHSQAQAMLDAWNQNVTQMIESQKTSVADGLNKLKTDLGETKANELIADAQLAVKELADEDFVAYLESTGKGNHPAELKFLAKVGQMLREDSAPGGEHGSSGLTAEEAAMEIAKIRNDKTHPYHKGDKTAVEHMDELYRAAYSAKVVATIGA